MHRSVAPRRILLTGDRGSVGRWLRPYLRHRSYEVHGFDRRDGHDVLNRLDVQRAAREVDVIVHAATLGWLHQSQSEVFETNVAGAECVLAAAEAAGHKRVILFSSPHVFGLFDGGPGPIRFPVSDAHPRSATSPYGRSKAAIEDLCEAFTGRTGITTLLPRPAHVWAPGQAADVRRLWKRSPSVQWDPVWHVGAFVDVRDLGDAIDRCLRLPLAGHRRFLLASSDSASLEAVRTLAARIHPDVPFDSEWKEGASLFDTSVARELLGWEPRYSWATESTLSLVERAAGRLMRSSEFGLWPRR